METHSLPPGPVDVVVGSGVAGLFAARCAAAEPAARVLEWR